tara:strand:+ start:2801 stop:3148 length:348 start_codon:yes stop_codon:yes gene_type:complete
MDTEDKIPASWIEPRTKAGKEYILSENDRFLEIFKLAFMREAMNGNYLTVGGMIDHIIKSGERLPPWFDKRLLNVIDEIEPVVRERRKQVGVLKRMGKRETTLERIRRSAAVINL